MVGKTSKKNLKAKKAGKADKFDKSEKSEKKVVNNELLFSRCKTEDDLRKVYNYEVDVFAEAGNFEWSWENLISEQKQGWEIYSLTLDQEILAAIFLRLDENALYTKNTSMKMSYQGHGYSHRIKEFYEQKAKEKAAKKIINFCAVDNFRTIALNESHGYQRIGVLNNGEVLKWEKTL
jgi:predicted GNAT family acetyltransferase